MSRPVNLKRWWCRHFVPRPDTCHPDGKGFERLAEWWANRLEDELNHYRLKAGRFEDIVNSGLKSSAHDEFITETAPPTLSPSDEVDTESSPPTLSPNRVKPEGVA